MEKVKAYVGGNFKTTSTLLKVTNPYTNSKFKEVYQAGIEELEDAIRSAQEIEEVLGNLPCHKKYSILMEIASRMKEKRDEFAHTITIEAGKPIRFSYAETDRAIQTFIVAAEESKRLPSEYFQIDWTPQGEGKEGLVKYFPVGLIAGISPFNFPLNLSVHKIAPAIAAGCPIILKPARTTPLSALLLAEIVNQTELPKGALSILPMNREIGNQLVTDERFNLLSFTGSPEVGWEMKKHAGKKRVVLELGGNAGVIITPTASIDQALIKCINGSFSYSGQVCIHTQRIYIHKDKFDEFTNRFLGKVKELIIGDPMNPSTDISSMIDFENAIRVEDWVNEAIRNGAKKLIGGERKGSYFEPTVLTNTKRSMKVCNSEVFGPVVVLEPYSSLSDAIAEINSSEYGLQAGIFTNSIDEQNTAFSKIKTGAVIINDTPTFRVDHMPYGGIKKSGFGREGVKYSILDMLEPRLLVRNFT